MSIDKKAYADYIAAQSKWQGGRIKYLRKDDNSDTHDIIGAAIVSTILDELRYLASAKPLNQHDIEAYAKGFMESAKMTTEVGPMGQINVVRVLS